MHFWILDCDPFFNFGPLLDFGPFLNFDFSIFQVFVHEIGHVLGMNHDFSQYGSRFCPTNEEVDCTAQMGHMHYLPVSPYFSTFSICF